MAHCIVCRGSGVVRLPVYRQLEALHSLGFDEAVDSAYREYPCPECKELSAPYSRLAIEKTERMMDARAPAAYRDAMRRGMVHAIADKIFELGLVSFEEGPENTRLLAIPVRATIAVVAPVEVAKLEERVAQRQIEVAEALVAETSEQIANWGSFYHGRTGGSVGKYQAIEWLQEALKKVKARYGKK